MTDPAPPARTTLTPECVYPHGMLDFMDTRCPSALAHGNAEGTWRVDCAPCFAEFSRAARAEGRLAGLAHASAVVAHARAHYAEDIFSQDGTSPECGHAKWARNLLDGITADITAAELENQHRAEHV